MHFVLHSIKASLQSVHWTNKLSVQERERVFSLTEHFFAGSNKFKMLKFPYLHVLGDVTACSCKALHHLLNCTIQKFSSG